MHKRKKLADILGQDGDRAKLKQAWEKTEAATDFSPLPAGEYALRILGGELFQARSGTAGYKLTLEATEGEHAGRRLWHDLWLTEASLPMTKKDLAKLGVTSLEQLEQPVPSGIIVRGRIVLRTGDDGRQFNRLQHFEVVGVEGSDPFAPTQSNQGGNV